MHPRSQSHAHSPSCRSTSVLVRVFLQYADKVHIMFCVRYTMNWRTPEMALAISWQRRHRRQWRTNGAALVGSTIFRLFFLRSAHWFMKLTTFCQPHLPHCHSPNMAHFARASLAIFSLAKDGHDVRFEVALDCMQNLFPDTTIPYAVAARDKIKRLLTSEKHGKELKAELCERSAFIFVELAKPLMSLRCNYFWNLWSRLCIDRNRSKDAVPSS